MKILEIPYIHRIQFGVPVWVWLMAFAFSYTMLLLGCWPQALGLTPLFIFCIANGKRHAG